MELQQYEDYGEGAGPPLPVLVVGHYCHDSLHLSSGVQVETLGGSVSYITNVFDALGLPAQIVSKVGTDFAYSSQISRHHIPRSIDGQHTTQFFADFSVGLSRVLKVSSICEPIFPWDIPFHSRYEIGLAVGVAGEVGTETLARMTDVSNRLVVDVQALIRTIDPVTGLVGLKKLVDTSSYGLLDRIAFLKAASDESVYLNVEDVRQRTSLIITEGKLGCTLYCKDRKFVVPAFTTTEVDPTGAGDSFLAGFSAGLLQGLSPEHAAMIGNYFGAVAVSQVGVPRFTQLHLQSLQRIRDGQLAGGIILPKPMDITQRFGQIVYQSLGLSSQDTATF